MLYTGRFLIGYSNGLWCQSGPVYTGEINQPKIRKFTGSFFTLSFTIGFALTYTLGSFCYWRDALISVSVWPVINFLLLFACPESPTWLMNKGRISDAKNTIKKIRNDDRVSQHEIDRMEENIQEQLTQRTNNKRSSYLQEQVDIITRGTFIRPFLVLTFILSITIQWCGTPAMGFYLVDILKGFKVPIDSYIAAALVATYRLVVVIFGAILSSFLPRRPFYLVCNVLVASGTLILGTCGYLHTLNDFAIIQEEYLIIKWLPIIGVLLFYTGVTAGIINVGFILLGEILPSNAREIGTTLVSTCTNISFFISTKFTPHLKEVLGLGALFCVYSGVSCLSLIFAYLYIPETFGKSLEEIEDHYRKICYGTRIKISVTDPDNSSRIVDQSDTILVKNTKNDRLIDACNQHFVCNPTSRRMSADSIMSMS